MHMGKTPNSVHRVRFTHVDITEKFRVFKSPFLQHVLGDIKAREGYTTQQGRVLKEITEKVRRRDYSNRKEIKYTFMLDGSDTYLNALVVPGGVFNILCGDVADASNGNV